MIWQSMPLGPLHELKLRCTFDHLHCMEVNALPTQSECVSWPTQNICSTVRTGTVSNHFRTSILFATPELSIVTLPSYSYVCILTQQVSPLTKRNDPLRPINIVYITWCTLKITIVHFWSTFKASVESTTHRKIHKQLCSHNSLIIDSAQVNSTFVWCLPVCNDSGCWIIHVHFNLHTQFQHNKRQNSKL